jgi:hypothetical protein
MDLTGLFWLSEPLITSMPAEALAQVGILLIALIL